MKDYFMNLYEFSPANTVKSCGFVSLIQYLSYLDTYINDNFIEEKYEATINAKSLQEAIMTSTGVVSTERRHDNVNNIRQYINSHLSDDYQCYLMELFSYYNLFTGDNDPDRTNIGLWQYQPIFDELINYGMPETPFYYSQVSNLNKEYILPSNIAKFDNIIKEKLDEGEPIIVHIAKEDIDSFNHSVVAYYYDSNGIYCNYGRGEYDTYKVIPDDEYVYEVGYLDLSMVQHKHSNSYNVNGTKYCGCGVRV